MTLTSADLVPNSFRTALGAFASSVCVITTSDDDNNPVGMTATAFSSVSADPLLVLVCINRSTRTYHYIEKRGRFGVNILGAVAQDISDYCAKSGADKTLDQRWLAEHDEWESPALAGALAFLSCSIEQNITAGTHAVLIGAVEAIGLSGSPGAPEPLVYFQGAYRPLQASIERRRPARLPILLEEYREVSLAGG